MKKKALIIFGGVSSEHDVSLISATSVIKNIPQEKYEIIMLGITKQGNFYRFNGSPDSLANDGWLSDAKLLERCVISCDREHHGIIHLPSGKIEYIDVAFPVLHGKNGEDGTMQGLLEIAGIPYVGCNTASSAVCMDKAITNAMCDFFGIAQAKWRSFTKYDYNSNKNMLLSKAADYLGFPIFVKPANAGSSVGISKADNIGELSAACEKAFKQDKKIVLEQGIDGVEVECAVLGNEEPIASAVGEIVPCNDFYDYDAKYIDNSTELYVPARLSDEKTNEVRAAAVEVFKALGCSGLARVDFFVQRSDGKVLLNEPNTIPGFTSISMYPKMFAYSGVSYGDLLDRLLTLAAEKA